MAFLETFRQLIERNEQFHPDEICTIFESRRTTFAEQARRVRKLAHAFHHLGMRKQDRVAMLAMNSPEHLDVSGAAEWAGYIVAPVNYRLAPAEMAYVINDCSPRVLVFESQYSEIIDRLRPQLPCVENFVCIGSERPTWSDGYQEILDRGNEDGPPVRPKPDDILSILYTSGTTGRPKGVMSTHKAFAWAALMQALEMGTDVGDRFLITMPMYHLAGRLFTTIQHLRGGTVILHRTFDPEAVARTIEREKVTQVHLAPVMLQALLDLPDIDRYDLSSIKTLQHAASPISLPLRQRALRKFGPILVDGYGQTEGGGTILRKNQQKLDGTPAEVRRLSSVGQPMLHAQMRIVDEEDREVPAGTVGEICFRTPQNMLGYWNNAAATVQALRNGWLHTGDMGFVDDQNFLFLVDRKKDMIISGGENIYSREVEEAIVDHPDVVDCAVIGVSDTKWGEAVMACVILRDGSALDTSALISHCRERIAGFKCPKRVEFVRELPRVPSGKINKQALRERFDG